MSERANGARRPGGQRASTIPAAPNADHLAARAVLSATLTPEQMSEAVRRGVGTAMMTPTKSSEQLATEAYRSAFDDYIRRDRVSPILQSRDMGQATGAAGAFTVPTGFHADLIRDMKAQAALLGHTTIIDTSGIASPGAPMNFPTLLDAANNSVTIAENTAITPVDPAFGNIAWPTAETYSAGALQRIGFGLAADSAFPLEDLLREAWALRAQRAIEADMAAAIIAGVTNSVTLTTTNVWTYSDVTQIYFTIDAAYRASAIWVLSTAAIKALRAAADTMNLRPLLLDAPQVQDTDNQGNVQSAVLLMGCRVIESNGGWTNAMTSSANIGCFINVPKVLPVRFAGASMITLNERFADFGQRSWTGFSRWNARTIALASAATLIKAH